MISHNVKRKKKNLWSPGQKRGVPIMLEEAEDEAEEAEGIVARMKKMRISDGLPWDAFGILVRTNSQARVIEETLMEAGLPYRTAGGPSFYQRKEVRDMLAYLKVAANPDDDMSVLRIINVPRRGIGKTGLEKISSFSRSRNLSIKTALEIMQRSLDPLANVKSVREAIDFFSFVETLRDTILSRGKPVSACLRDMVSDIGYWHYILEENKSNDKAAAWRYRNIELLAASIERWEKDPDTLDSGLYAYLARVALVTRDDPEDEEGKDKSADDSFGQRARIRCGLRTRLRGRHTSPCEIHGRRRRRYRGRTEAVLRRPHKGEEKTLSEPLPPPTTQDAGRGYLAFALP